MKRALTLWVAGSLFLLAVAAAGERGGSGSGGASAPAGPTGRDLFSRLMRDLADPFDPPQLAAIQQLSQQGANQTNDALFAEFKVGEKLVEIAEDAKMDRSPVVRTEAIKALSRLANAGKAPTGAIDVIVRVIEDKGGDIRVRQEALTTIADLGGRENSKGATDAFNALKKLWQNRAKTTPPLPQLLQIRLIEALGGFARQEGVKKILTDALKEVRGADELRAGILRGLGRYLDLSQDTKDKELLSEMLKLIRETKSAEVKLEAIRVTDIVLASGGAAEISPSTKSALKELLKSSTDEEVQMAARLLVRMLDAEVVTALLETAVPKEGSTLSVPTYQKLNQALAASLKMLRANAGREDAKGMAVKIRDHFFVILDPRAKWPVSFRREAIVILKDWPNEFDRSEIVKTLIDFLEYALAKEPDLATDVEDALTWQTNQKYRVRKDVQGKMIEMADIEQFKGWLEKNKDKLAPGKTPYE